jgi:hypothetical protein
MRRGVALKLIAAVIVTAGLVYLRDPGWLARVDSGLGRWETESDGTRYRWAGGHASFFIPSDATTVIIPVRTTFANASEPEIVLSVFLDDRHAGQLALRDDRWQTSTLRMPPRGGRHLRRIDLKSDRLRGENRAVQVGEVVVR